MAGAAQHRADARQQFLGAERLGQIIVGAGVEPGHAVGLADARGQHDHRRGAALAKLSQHFEAIQHGQHHVEDDQVEAALEGARQAGASIVRGLDLKTVLRESSRTLTR